MTTFAHGQLRRLPTQHAKSAILLVGCVSLVMVLLVTAVTAAVGLGGLASLGGLLGGGRLDYARGPLGEFFPLTDGFVADTLGPGFSRGAASNLSADPLNDSGPGRATIPAPTNTGADSSRSDDAPLPDEVSPDLGNDNFAEAYAIRGLPFTTRISAPSTREPGEPTPCGPPGGGSRWFRYTPRSDVGLLATTRGTELGSSISVYTGDSMDELTVIGCGGGPNNGGQVPFAASAGTTYWFQAVKTVGDGALVFTLDLQGATILASRDAADRPADADTTQPRLSANGRYVAFSSAADLVPGTQNGCLSDHRPEPFGLIAKTPGPCYNIYVRDLVADTTELVSTADGEVGGDDDSSQPAISADGRFIAFYSFASDLVQDDTNASLDVFVRDRQSHLTTRVSVRANGREAKDPVRFAGHLAISDNGRFVAFSSGAPELARDASAEPCQGYPCAYVFIRDVAGSQVHLVSQDGEGDPYPGYNLVGGMTTDGSRIAFTTDLNGTPDVVVSRWREPRAVELASVAMDGGRPNGESRTGASHSLSADGRFVVFRSAASNLVPNDTNGDGELDIFLRDLVSNRTTRVSVASDGAQAAYPQDDTGELFFATPLSTGFTSATISANGRFVAFASNATNLVPGDTNGTFDVFVHDLRRRTTSRVSVLDDESQSPGASFLGVVSADGRTVSFAARGFESGDASTSTTEAYVRRQPAA